MRQVGYPGLAWTMRARRGPCYEVPRHPAHSATGGGFVSPPQRCHPPRHTLFVGVQPWRKRACAKMSCTPVRVAVPLFRDSRSRTRANAERRFSAAIAYLRCLTYAAIPSRTSATRMAGPWVPPMIAVAAHRPLDAIHTHRGLSRIREIASLKASAKTVAFGVCRMMACAPLDVYVCNYMCAIALPCGCIDERSGAVFATWSEKWMV